MSDFEASTFVTYEQIEQAMEQVVKREFNDKPFFITLLNGEFSQPQIRHFAIQYSYYSRHFPRVLGAAISAMAPLDTWWVPLADNLWDEAGRGIAGKSHEQLYKTFLRSVYPDVQLDEKGVPVQPISPAVLNAIEFFVHFFR